MKGFLVIAALLGLAACAPEPPKSKPVTPTSTPGLAPRDVLPIPEPGWSPPRELSASGVIAPPRQVVRPPEGAPNVIVILLDDLGFAATSPFGGPVATPSIETLARKGLRYNQFHTAGADTPTRQALLTGRDAHLVNHGRNADQATGMPGYTAVPPTSAAPLAEVMRLNGYSTAAFGKWSATPPWERSEVGPFERWPTGQGFEHFRGTLGESDRYTPVLYEGTTQVGIDGETLTDDLTGHAVAWIARQRSLVPDKPFFLYFAPPAGTVPQQVPERYSAPYAGKFDDGWTALRTTLLANQQALGVVPTNVKLAPADLPDWDALSADQKRLAARQAEVFAGLVAETDAAIGRIVQALRETAAIDDTLILLVTTDQGIPVTGTPLGALNALSIRNGVKRTPNDPAPWGTQGSYPVMGDGWALAFSAPFADTSPVVSDWGATRAGLVVHWPRGLTNKGGVRPQFSHVTDLAPTILEVAKLPVPAKVHGVPQQPMTGSSLVPTFGDATAPSPHSEQLFEYLGHRGLYHDGWYARAEHIGAYDADPWTLYDTRRDYALTTEVDDATRLQTMRDRFDAVATELRAFPLDDRPVGDGPTLVGERTSMPLLPGGAGLPEDAFLHVGGQDFRVDARVEVKDGDSGVLIAQGGRNGGWAVLLDAGRPTFTANWLGAERSQIQGPPLKPGDHRIRVDFTYRGSVMAKGDISIEVDGAQVATGFITGMQPVSWGPETVDVGLDRGSPVGDYAVPNAFTGTLKHVVVSLR